MKKLGWILFGALSVAVSFYPIKYLIADKPVALLTAKSAELLASFWYNLSFYNHIIFGGIALLIGWIQFSKNIRTKHRKIHRWIGKAYVLSVMISGPFGFYIALFATGGLSPKLGFSIGAVLWTVITYLGFRAIMRGNVERHRQFLMYSYAGTFGAVTLRIWLPLLIAIKGNFIEAYQIVAWLSWLPNLLVVYLIINKSAVTEFFNDLKIFRRKVRKSKA